MSSTRENGHLDTGRPDTHSTCDEKQVSGKERRRHRTRRRQPAPTEPVTSVTCVAYLGEVRRTRISCPVQELCGIARLPSRSAHPSAGTAAAPSPPPAVRHAEVGLRIPARRKWHARASSSRRPSRDRLEGRVRVLRSRLASRTPNPRPRPTRCPQWALDVNASAAQRRRTGPEPRSS